MPLTTITAWEILFDSFGLKEGEGAGEALLVIGGAGGVGSILIQLAKKLTGLTVIATASRSDTRAWVEKMGADHIVNHRRPLDEEMKALGVSPRYVASLTHTDKHFASILPVLFKRGGWSHIVTRLTVIPAVVDIVPVGTDRKDRLRETWDLRSALGHKLFKGRKNQFYDVSTCC